MNNYNAELILDSIVSGQRITCFRVTYPRIVHSEFLRHRIMSFCSASSRAIPILRMIEQYFGYFPELWRKHQPGMQPLENYHFTQKEIEYFEEVFSYISNKSKDVAIELAKQDLAKEVVNRIIEPYSFITHLIQTTDDGFNRFFTLRLAKQAQFEIRKIAGIVKDIYDSSSPIEREIHLPFYQESIIGDNYKNEVYDFLNTSSARCARTSFYNHEGKIPTLKEDLDLSENLNRDKHFSPFEFPVMSLNLALQLFSNRIDFSEKISTDRVILGDPSIYIYKDFSGNLNNWRVVQYRKLLEAIND